MQQNQSKNIFTSFYLSCITIDDCDYVCPSFRKLLLQFWSYQPEILCVDSNRPKEGFNLLCSKISAKIFSLLSIYITIDDCDYVCPSFRKLLLHFWSYQPEILCVDSYWPKEGFNLFCRKIGAKNILTHHTKFGRPERSNRGPGHTDPEWNRLVHELLNFKNMLKKQ